MHGREYWSKSTNPETGEKFERFLEYIKVAHNGYMDIDGFLDSEYGNVFAGIQDVRFRLEEDPQGPRATEYYESLGLQMWMHDDEDYYTRWMMLVPRTLAAGKRYPLVIANHGGGNAIETDEFAFGLPQIAGKESFMVLYAQNTNWQNLLQLLEKAQQQYPVDPERVYMAGYSQGGYQTSSALLRIPERLAAVAPCGNDIFRTYDNFNIPYTQGEYDRLKTACVPVIQVVGQCEASFFVPVNDWKPRKNWGYDVGGEPYVNPRKNNTLDPTRIKGGPRSFSAMPVPPEGTDKHQWMIQRLNMRMELLGCALRDPETCIGYLNTPQDTLHHVLGFYGDQEEIRTYYGYKHYMLQINDNRNWPVFRYVAVENSPHWPPVMMGRLIWDFFKQFRRDSCTGKLMFDPYVS